MTAAADGHGGIKSIEKLSTSVLADTYRITLADTTVFDFVVNNGRGITGISKTGTSGLIDTYTISYNNGTTSTFTVKNGEKGDKGDNTYIWIKYASQEPTESSHSIGDLPDDWIGIYSGNASTAPTDWKQYKWFKHKGEKGDTGAPSTLVNKSVTYQVSDSGTIIPSGSWGSSIPVVSQGKYLWTKTALQFNTGDPVISYSVTRMGLDGSGTVSSVSNVSPDETGNVALTAANVGALPITGGELTGELKMNGQPISGLNEPTEGTQAASKAYVDKRVPLDGSVPMTGNLAMGYHRITGLAEPEDDGDAATKGYVDTNKVDKANVANSFTTTEEGYVADARSLKVLNDSKLSMEPLWENASPTSSLAAQSIDLNLDSFSLVRVVYISGIDYPYVKYMYDFHLGETAILSGVNSLVAGDTGNSYFYARKVNVNSGGVVFESGYERKVNVTDPNYAVLNDGSIIPILIYGIRGVVK